MNFAEKWLKNILSKKLGKPFEIKINSQILTWAASKFIEIPLKKKLGSSVDVQLNSIILRGTENGRVHAHLDIDCETEKEAVQRLLNREEPDDDPSSEDT